MVLPSDPRYQRLPTAAMAHAEPMSPEAPAARRPTHRCRVRTTSDYSPAKSHRSRFAGRTIRHVHPLAPFRILCIRPCRSAFRASGTPKQPASDELLPPARQLQYVKSLPAGLKRASSGHQNADNYRHPTGDSPLRNRSSGRVLRLSSLVRSLGSLRPA
jgi:hypothetical protein